MAFPVKTVAVLGVVVALGAGAATFASINKGKKNAEPHAKVERGALRVVVSETGTVQPLTKVEIKSKVAGQVAKLLVDVGQKVEKGQLLIQLDTTDMERERARAAADRDQAAARLALLKAGSRREELTEARAQVSQQEAAFARAEADYRRSEEALKAGTITPREAESARSDYFAAKAQLDASRARLAKIKAGPRLEEIAEAKAQLARAEVALKATEDQLSYASIRSPMAGTVIKRGIEVGEMVSPGVSATAQGTSMLTVADLDRLIIASSLNQIDVGKVRKGQKVEVRVDSAPGKVFTGEIRKVAPAAEASKDGQSTIQTFPIETILAGTDADALKPGMSADLDVLVTNKEGALYLPVEAVIRGKGLSGSVTLPAKEKGAKPATASVTLGLATDTQIEILSGLVEGQEVLIKPAPSADNTMKF
ncbi:efflux RND transporter periplasmic adaptor subunit [bacterium]|nr:efflux RND transporter periplasmic adaptor subunit [bacterium]